MARRPSAALLSLARRSGVLTEYYDVEGHRQRASAATLVRILRARGFPIRTPADASRRLPRSPSTAGPPAVVLRARARPRLARFRVPPTERGAPLRGGRIRLSGARAWRPLAVRGRGSVVASRPIPAGVHDVRLRYGDGERPGVLVVGPSRLPPPPGGRRWGIFAPVYALRDSGTWGCGDLRALEAYGKWAARWGASLVVTLPLLPAFLDRPFEPSPYRPVSQRFWNEVFLDPTRTPEFRRSRFLRKLLRSRRFRVQRARLESLTHVDFRAVARLKRRVVERMLREFATAPRARRRAFATFRAATPELEEYAAFRARGERNPARGAAYHRFAQWLVDEQLRGVARRLARRGVALGLDLPLGTHPRGFDARVGGAALARGIHVGSPPDPGVPLGQDWSFPPFDPDRLRAVGYRPFSAALRHELRVAGLLRVDHVLGFRRLFWIPTGDPPSAGAYVRSASAELYAVLLAEAARAGATIVGEDLGTVPPELRPELRAHGLLSMYVAELEWDGGGRPRAIPRECVAYLNTHDHLPFAGYWAERVRADRPATPGGGFPSADVPCAIAFREAMERLARSPARFVVVTVEDLWGETRPQNVPGRIAGSFTRRFRVDLATVRRDPAAAELLSTFRALRPRRHAR